MDRRGPLTRRRRRRRTTATPLLSLRGINKSFGAVHVLRGVDLDVRPGQVTALVGDNGAGKSTLIKGIAGIHAFDAGEYLFEGQPVTVHGPKDANALGIEVVYQDLALCDNLDVVQNMFLGRELRQRRGCSTRTPWRPAPARPSTACRCAPSSRCARRSPASPAASGRPSRSPAPCCGTPARHPRRADRRPGRRPDRAGAPAGPPAGRPRPRRVLISHNLNDVFEVADDIAVLYLGADGRPGDAEPTSPPTRWSS